MAGIYIHIPFCKSKCVYCDFYSSTDLSTKKAVLEAIRGEMRQRREYIGDEPVRTIYFGGGTPSLCTAAELCGLTDTVHELWDCVKPMEITLEANPDDLTVPKLEEMAEAGINRLSIGIQSFCDRHLKFMKRRHDARSAEESVKRAQQAGFTNISVDLIYGIPGMTAGEWKETLLKALSLNVGHISAYHLTIEHGTPLHRMYENGEISPVGEAAGEEQFSILHGILTDGGYEHYEVSNFARRGFRSRHNSAYWDGSRYLGVGPSAHSYDGTSRSGNAASVKRYLDPHLRVSMTEILTERDLYNEFLMTSLRRIEGVDLKLLQERFGTEYAARLEAGARKFTGSGMLVRDGGSYRIPPEKYFISDGIIRELFMV